MSFQTFKIFRPEEAAPLTQLQLNNAIWKYRPDAEWHVEDVVAPPTTPAAGREAHEIWERTRGDENECDAERRFREDTEHSTEWWNGWLERSDAWRDEIGHDKKH
jgi:hypothetical protein